MKHVLVCLGFLCSGLVLAAQQPGPFTITPGRPTIIGCPVQLHAQHGKVTGSMVAVGTAQPAEPSQNLHLTLTNPDWKQIASAKVRFYGTSGKARIDSTTGAGSYDSTRTMDVQFKGTTWRQVSSDVAVPGMTSVIEMDLTEVTFSDGKVWKLSGCRFAPDPLMLVTGQ